MIEQQKNPENRGGEKEEAGVHMSVVLDRKTLRPCAFLIEEETKESSIWFPGQKPSVIQGHVDQIINKEEYTVNKSPNDVFYHKKGDNLGPLSFVGISWDELGTHVRLPTRYKQNDTDQQAFFLQLANRLRQKSLILPFADWKPKTADDLALLSYMYFKSFAKARSQVERKVQETFIILSETNHDMKSILSLVGLKSLGSSDIGLCLTEKNDSPAGVFIVDKKLAALCFFPAITFHQDSHAAIKWAIAISLGWLTKGQEFDLDRERYLGQRGLSDFVLGYFTYSLNPRVPDWGPREYNLEELAERHQPALQVLSAIWERFPPDKRKKAAVAVWQRNFGQKDLQSALEFVKSFK